MSGFPTTGGSGTGIVGNQARLQPQLSTILAQVATTATTIRRILFVGDSRASGAISLVACSVGWFGFLANLLASQLGTSFGANTNSSPTVARGLSIPTSVSDPRWTVGTNWVYNALGTQLGWAPGVSNAPTGGAFFGGNGTSGTLVFNPGGAAAPVPAVFCDTFDVFYGTAVSGGGTVSGQATGGASAGITINTGSAGVAKQTFSAAGAANNNTLTLTLSGSGPVFIFGVEPRLSLASSVLLAQAGVNAASALAWNTAPSTAGMGSVALINLYNPDLVVWELLGDDCFVDKDTPSTALTNLLTLITATVGVSKSVLMTISNIGAGSVLGAAAPATLPPYMAALRSFGAQQGIPVIDIDGSWDGPTGLLPSALLTSLYSSDQLHPNTAGYYAQARYISQALAGILGTM